MDYFFDSLVTLEKCQKKSCKKERNISIEYNKKLVTNVKTKPKINPINAKENVDFLKCSINKCNKDHLIQINASKKMICSLTKLADLKKAKFNCKPEKNITLKKAQELNKQIIKLKSIKS